MKVPWVKLRQRLLTRSQLTNRSRGSRSHRVPPRPALDRCRVCRPARRSCPCPTPAVGWSSRPRPPVRRSLPLPDFDLIVAGPAVDPVVPGLRGDQVVAGAAADPVRSGPGRDPVVPGATLDLVQAVPPSTSSSPSPASTCRCRRRRTASPRPPHRRAGRSRARRAARRPRRRRGARRPAGPVVVVRAHVGTLGARWAHPVPVQHVPPGTAVDPVVLAEAEDDVVAALGEHLILPGVPCRKSVRSVPSIVAAENASVAAAAARIHPCTIPNLKGPGPFKFRWRQSPLTVEAGSDDAVGLQAQTQALTILAQQRVQARSSFTRSSRYATVCRCA